jgi:hypothetical protein
MKSKLFLAGILATALVFGIVVIGCNNGGEGITIDGWKWVKYTDKDSGGMSTITMTRDIGNRLTFVGNLTASTPNGEWEPYGYAGCYVEPNATHLVALKNTNSFSFKCKGDGKSYILNVKTSDVTDTELYRFVFETSEEERVIGISYDELEQPDWVTPVAFNKNKITAIDLPMVHTSITETGSFNVTIWDLKVGKP